jgi:hypothetical protein
MALSALLSLVAGGFALLLVLKFNLVERIDVREDDFRVVREPSATTKAYHAFLESGVGVTDVRLARSPITSRVLAYSVIAQSRFPLESVRLTRTPPAAVGEPPRLLHQDEVGIRRSGFTTGVNIRQEESSAAIGSGGHLTSLAAG